jgi:hypothetical protein
MRSMVSHRPSVKSPVVFRTKGCAKPASKGGAGQVPIAGWAAWLQTITHRRYGHGEPSDAVGGGQSTS